MAKKKKALTGKQRLWLAAYLDQGSDTFMHATNSARAAGYSAKTEANLAEIGYRNKKSLQPYINEWLDEEGLSDNALKLKLVELLDAKETKFFAHEGEVVDEREITAWGTQTKALDMAMKMKGMYSPEKHEHEVSGFGAIIKEIQGKGGNCLSD